MGRRTILVDDIDGTELTEGEAEATVSFSYKGTDYTIDLGKKNRDTFDKALAKYTEKATVVERPRELGRPGASAGRGRGRPAGGTQPARVDREQLTAIREWAKKNGHEVSDRGRISKAVQDAYHAATAA